MRDLDPFGRETTDPLEILDQDLYHRLVEVYGSNPDDADRGVGIVDALSGVEGRDLASEIRADSLKDDRVAEVRATVSPMGDVVGGYRISIEVQAVDGVLNIEAALVDGILSRVVS